MAAVTTRGLTKRYKEITAVDHLDLRIESGELFSLLGVNGAGKSTLINLIMRLYDVDSGSILIDGVDIRDISQESLRRQTGVVLQETFLFTGTIYDNIAYAKPDAPRDEIIRAAKLSGAHKFIIKLADFATLYKSVDNLFNIAELKLSRCNACKDT